MIDIEKIKNNISLEKNTINDIEVGSIWNHSYINKDGLTDEELLVTIVFAYNTMKGEPDVFYPITIKKIKSYTDWSAYKIKKLYKKLSELTVSPMINDEGYLCGSGYIIKTLTK